MPYIIRKVDNKYKIIKKNTGKVVGTSKSRKIALKAIAARYAAESRKK